MKFKLDENLDPRLALLFEQAGHEVSTVTAEALMGADDQTIFQVCREESRCLVTLDLDFSNPLRFPPGITSGIIILRPPRPILPLIRASVESLFSALKQREIKGRLWIVEPVRIREYTPES